MSQRDFIQMALQSKLSNNLNLKIWQFASGLLGFFDKKNQWTVFQLISIFLFLPLDYRNYHNKICDLFTMLYEKVAVCNILRYKTLIKSR